MTRKAQIYLKLSSLICKIGNYFWHKHVKGNKKTTDGIRPENEFSDTTR